MTCQVGGIVFGVYAALASGDAFTIEDPALGQLDAANLILGASVDQWVDITRYGLAAVDVGYGDTAGSVPSKTHYSAAGGQMQFYDPARRLDPTNGMNPWGNRLHVGVFVKVEAVPPGAVDPVSLFYGRLEASTHELGGYTTWEVADLTADLARFDADEVPDEGLGDTTAGRVARWLDIASWPPGQRNLLGVGAAMDSTNLGANVWGGIVSTVIADVGRVWVDRYGIVQLRCSDVDVIPPYSVAFDLCDWPVQSVPIEQSGGADIVNIVSGKREKAATVSDPIVISDGESIARYGPSRVQRHNLPLRYDEDVTEWCQRFVDYRSSPGRRASSLSVRCDLSDPAAVAFLNVELGDVWQISDELGGPGVAFASVAGVRHQISAAADGGHGSFLSSLTVGRYATAAAGPPDITGIVHEWYAPDLVTVEGLAPGDPVVSWTDRVGGIVVNRSAGSSPVTLADLQGRAVCRFGLGTQSRLIGQLPAIGGPYTVLAVARSRDTSTNGTLAQLGEPVGQAVDGQMLMLRAPGAWQGYKTDAPAGAATSITDPWRYEPVVWAVESNRGDGFPDSRVDDLEQTSASGGQFAAWTTTATNFTLGNRNSASQPWSGDLVYFAVIAGAWFTDHPDEFLAFKNWAALVYGAGQVSP